MHPAGESTLLSAPPKGSEAPARAARRGPGRGRFVAFLTLVLAFVLASFPARNTDFWLHLATGRHLANHPFDSGANPFTYTSPEASWVNHAWLYDVLLYLLYPILGGAALVVLKGLGIAGLAWVLILCGRVGRGLWLPAVGTVLALLAMSPWLQLGPSCLSFLFLGVTLWFLEKRQPDSADRRGRLVASFLSAYWPLLALFLFWANLDGGFVAGLLMVALYWAGQLLPTGCRRGGNVAADFPSAGSRTMLGLLAAAAVLICLVNPWQVRIFMPSPEWGLSGAAEFQNDPYLRNRLLAPLRHLYFTPAMFGSSAGPSYWMLVFLGVVSFGVNRARWRWERVFVFTSFLILSLLHSQAIPLFAVVAGPILALNFGECVQFRAGPARPGAFGTIARLGLALSILALAVAAWTGTLQSHVRGPRAWGVEADPSLRLAADQLQRWRQQGALGKGRGFNFVPEAADYFAWACPDEQGFLNGGLQASAEEAADYVAVRRGLLMQDAGGQGFGSRKWRDILRARGVNHVVVYSNEDRHAEVVMRHLLSQEQEWPLLHLQGRTAIFGWRPQGTEVPHHGQDRRAPDLFRNLELPNLDRLVFAADSQTEAPGAAPVREPQPFFWWDSFWRPRPSRSVFADEARMALIYFEARTAAYARRHERTWNNGLFASWIAGAAPAGLSPFPRLNLQMTAAGADDSRTSFFLGQDDGPREALYLAIRAGRRAVWENPDDPQAYLALGEAYYLLGQHSRERSWAVHFDLLGRLRTVQAIAAFNFALRLNSDLPQAHARLVGLFEAMGYQDLALKHRRHYVELFGRRPPPGMPGEEFAQRLQGARQLLQARQKRVEELREKYDLNRANLKVLDRALLAGRMGLAGEALEILLKSDVSAFGRDGLDLELKLLLITGGVDKVRWMNPKHRKALGTHDYHWNRAQQEAATGNYRQADLEIRQMLMFPGPKGDMPLGAVPGFMMGHGLLAETRGGLFQIMPPHVWAFLGQLPNETFSLLPEGRQIMMGNLWRVASGLNREASLTALRGLLALEAGRFEPAVNDFRTALAFWNSPAGAPFRDPQTLAARRVAEQNLAWLVSSKKNDAAR
jgi:tetratricopeptide (TPR) repeat protein